jgi:ADP-ribose pyrophosphatase YjhB (NUDIX family)
MTTRAQCIVIREGVILLPRHRSGDHEWWCLPGGAVEPGETDAEAALRELKEECCVTGTIIRETAISSEEGGRRSHTFLIDIGDQEPTLGSDPEEAMAEFLIGIAWLRLDEVSERDRAFLWAAGLLGVKEFLEEVSPWGDKISYPRNTDD